MSSYRRMAITKDGRMTWCTSPPDKIGTGRCNHVAHQEEGEKVEAFVQRANSEQGISGISAVPKEPTVQSILSEVKRNEPTSMRDGVIEFHDTPDGNSSVYFKDKDALNRMSEALGTNNETETLAALSDRYNEGSIEDLRDKFDIKRSYTSDDGTAEFELPDGSRVSIGEYAFETPTSATGLFDTPERARYLELTERRLEEGDLKDEDQEFVNQYEQDVNELFNKYDADVTIEKFSGS